MTTPPPTLYVLVGAAGAGKSTYAARRWHPDVVVCADDYRAKMAGDPCDQDVNREVWEVVYLIIAARLRRGLDVVMDSTGDIPALRTAASMAAEHHARAELVIITTPLETCLQRNATRPGPRPGQKHGRRVPDYAVQRQYRHTTSVLAAVEGSLANIAAGRDPYPLITGYHQATIVAADGEERTIPLPWHPRRLIVTGSRTWTDHDRIRQVLTGHYTPGAVLVSGACPKGVDAIAERVWTELGGRVERHPADWTLGPIAGPTRNAEMVNLGADLCVAFVRGESRGTRNTIDIATRAGIPVDIHEHQAEGRRT